MSMTTIKISAALRDRLAHIAADDFDRSTLAAAVERLVNEHEDRAALDAYDRLRADEQEWASYRDESSLTDNVAGDWLRQGKPA